MTPYTDDATTAGTARHRLQEVEREDVATFYPPGATVLFEGRSWTLDEWSDRKPPAGGSPSSSHS